MPPVHEFGDRASVGWGVPVGDGLGLGLVVGVGVGVGVGWAVGGGVAVGPLLGLGWSYVVGCLLVAALLAWSHVDIARRGLQRVGMGFMTVNGVVGLVYGVVAIVAVLLK